MPGTNLTAQEAERRSHAVTVDTVDIKLDLRDADSATFRSVTEIHFDCTDPCALRFLCLQSPALWGVVVNGRALDVDRAFRDSQIELSYVVPGRNDVRVVADCISAIRAWLRRPVRHLGTARCLRTKSARTFSR